MLQPTTNRLAVLIGLVVGVAATANAAIIYMPGQDIPIPNTFAGVSVNLETGATGNAIQGIPGGDANFFLGGVGISNDADQLIPAPTWQPVRTGTGNTDAVVNLAPNTIVGPGSVTGDDFGASGGVVSHFPTFVSGTPGFVGFSLVLADLTTAYGWAYVTLQDDNTPGVIHSWAYQDSGSPIRAGQTIPEPSHALLTVFGLAALALRRRR